MIAKALAKEMKFEFDKTIKALERAPMERADFKPHERSFSLIYLTNHLANLPGWGVMTMQTDYFDMTPEAGDAATPKNAETGEELVNKFREKADELVALLERATDEEMMKIWEFRVNGNVIISMPKVDILKLTILNHLIHHRGQYTVYLRMLDVPVPNLYGPSADEN